MGYYTVFCFFVYFIIKPCEVSSITTRIAHNQPVRNFRRHTGQAPFTDWELGLRESVHQALLREHYTEPSLREQLLEAPLLGRENNASPFGDIAVLARGQLYITSEGFKFLQDSDQDDCGDVDCHHNPRCVGTPQCRKWSILGHHNKLLALWTVKRIRHRDPSYGHVFEIEYTISPITSAINEELVRRHGYFNYNVPGHIFVIKSNPRADSAYYLNGSGDKWYKNQPPVEQTQDKTTGNTHFKPGILIGVGPDGYMQVLHSFPGFYSSYHPQHHYKDQTTIDPKEYELYKKLIESLAAKTSNSPHRFSATTPTKPTYHLTTFVPQTTFVQLVPLTENTLSPTTTKLTTPVKIPTTVQTRPTQVTKYSEPDLFYRTLQTTTKPITTIHYYTPVEEPIATTPPKIPTTTSKPTRKTTLEDIDFDIFTSKTTTPKVTPALTTQPEQLELVPVSTSTEPMQPVTEIPTSPKPTNEQLPPPRIDTTVPYISSTVNQPATTQKLTTYIPAPREEITTVIEKIPYTEGTTVILPVTSPQEERSTTSGRTTKATTTSDKIYTVTATSPSTLPQFSTISEPSTIVTERESTIFDHGTTPVITLLTETIPTTRRQPTTIFQYTFDTTTKAQEETSTSTFVPSTQTVKFTIPTTTYYYFANEPPAITTETTFSTDSTTPSKETTYTEQETTSSQAVPSTTTKRVPQVASTASIDDFLLDVTIDKGKPPKVTDSKKDFNEDDIFGTSVVKPTKESSTTTKLVLQSDVDKALFGNRTSKQLKHSSKVTKRPVANTTRIIYNNFFAPSTSKYEYETTTSGVTTTPKISTEQSYSTSISFEVNKRHKGKTETLLLEPTVKADLQELNHTEYTIYMAELPKDLTTTTEKSLETKRAFDDIALQLVNHARSIDYLSRKSSRQPKYKRRSYTTRRKSSKRGNTNEGKKEGT